MALNLYTSVAKELRLKLRKFLGLIRTFVLQRKTGRERGKKPSSWIELTHELPNELKI